MGQAQITEAQLAAAQANGARIEARPESGASDESGEGSSIKKKPVKRRRGQRSQKSIQNASEIIEGRILATLALLAPDLVFEPQYVFLKDRKFRADFACVAARVLIEYNGGTWSSGAGHAWGAGIRRDVEKTNRAQLDGWAVFVLTADMITGAAIVPSLEPFIAFCRARLASS